MTFYHRFLEYSVIPVLKGAEKDHKDTDGAIRMMAIVNAMDGPKKTLSDIFSDLMNGIVEASNDNTLCSSTEELLEAFETYNKEVEHNVANVADGKRIVGSMDAVSLYPSLKANRSAEIVKEVIMNCNVKFNNINFEELGIYLRTNLPRQYIQEEGYDDILPIRVTSKSNGKRKGNPDYKNNEDALYDYVEDLEALFNQSYVENVENDDDEMDDEITDNNPGTMVGIKYLNNKLHEEESAMKISKSNDEKGTYDESAIDTSVYEEDGISDGNAIG